MAEATNTTRGFSRRTFIGASGAAVGAAYVLKPNPGGPNALSQLAARHAGPRASIGYVPATEGATAAEARALLEAGGARVVPAARLRSGGATLGGGAVSIGIDGDTLGGNGAGRVVSAQLDALVQPNGMPKGADPVPFYAWTMGGSNSVSFVVPFEREPTVGLGLRVKGQGAADWSESLSVFTGGADRGLDKLRTGTYLVGLDNATWSSEGTLPAIGDVEWERLTSVLLTVSSL